MTEVDIGYSFLYCSINCSVSQLSAIYQAMKLASQIILYAWCFKSFEVFLLIRIM